MKQAIALAALAALALPAQAQDAERGQLLYQTYCGICHYERVHERDRARSMVKTLTELKLTVARWAPYTKRAFTPEELDDVAEYLNRSHYKLEK
jgi:mono/diheme cytochrome c family protein